MKNLIALLCVLFIAGCMTPGGGLPYTVVATTHGEGTLAFDGNNFVAVSDGLISGGIYNVGTNVPIVIEGEVMSWSFVGQRVIIRHLRDPKAACDLALNDAVPFEFQHYVISAIPPELLESLQARGILVFETDPKP